MLEFRQNVRVTSTSWGSRLGLSCLSIVSLLAGGLAGMPDVTAAPIASSRADSSIPLLAFALLSLVPAATLGLAAWTWRTNRVVGIDVVIALGAGGLGIALSFVPAAIAYISTRGL